MSIQNLKSLKLINKTLLIDVGHVKSVGDDVVQNGIIIGKVTQSEVPSYGVVVAFSDDLGDVFKVGDIVPFPSTGVLRAFDWPGKGKDQKLVTVKADALDGVVTV